MVKRVVEVGLGGSGREKRWWKAGVAVALVGLVVGGAMEDGEFELYVSS